jgi:hypothetical protein
MALKIRSVVRLEDAFQARYVGKLEVPVVGEISDDTLVLSGWVYSSIGQTLERVCLRCNHFTVAATSVSLSRPDAENYLKQIGFASPTEACGFHGEFSLSLLRSPVTFDITVREASGCHFPIYRLTVEHNTELQPHRTALRPLLLTTLGRTGSTWLSALLALHPEVFCQSEVEPRLGLYWLSALAAVAQPKSFLRKYDALDLSDSQWWLGGAGVDTAIVRIDGETERQLGFLSAQRFAQFVGEELSAHYSAIASKQGKTPIFFLEKYLPNLYPELMSRVVMGSKEIFLVRDWRDMIASIESYSRQRGMDLFGTTRDAGRGEQIRAQVEAVEMMRVAWEQRKDTALLVRYEDLLSDISGQVERIFRYLEVDTDGATLSLILENWVARSADFKEQRTTPSYSASIGRWKTDLSAEEGVLATELYHDSLVSFGYET